MDTYLYRFAWLMVLNPSSSWIMETVISYATHCPEGYAWAITYKHSMGVQSFNKFLDRVYERLMRMEVGEVYDLTNKVSDKNRDLFIKCAWLFIDEGNDHYSFTEDYTQIIRRCTHSTSKAIDLLASKRKKQKTI